jgi:hypothetical protein
MCNKTEDYEMPSTFAIKNFHTRGDYPKNHSDHLDTDERIGEVYHIHVMKYHLIFFLSCNSSELR